MKKVFTGMTSTRKSTPELFVSQIEMIAEGDVFPWPEFRYETVFLESFRLQIRGIANEKGLEYFQDKILKN